MARELAEVQLYFSTNGGGTWQFYSKVDPVTGRFLFRAPNDGEYWFTVRTVDRAGQSSSVGANSAQLIVVVDTTPPKCNSPPGAARPARPSCIGKSRSFIPSRAACRCSSAPPPRCPGRRSSWTVPSRAQSGRCKAAKSFSTPPPRSPSWNSAAKCSIWPAMRVWDRRRSTCVTWARRPCRQPHRPPRSRFRRRRRRRPAMTRCHRRPCRRARRGRTMPGGRAAICRRPRRVPIPLRPPATATRPSGIGPPVPCGPPRGKRGWTFPNRAGPTRKTAPWPSKSMPPAATSSSPWTARRLARMPPRVRRRAPRKFDPRGGTGRGRVARRPKVAHGQFPHLRAGIRSPVRGPLRRQAGGVVGDAQRRPDLETLRHRPEQSQPADRDRRRGRDLRIPPRGRERRRPGRPAAAERRSAGNLDRRRPDQAHRPHHLGRTRQRSRRRQP